MDQECTYITLTVTEEQYRELQRVADEFGVCVECLAAYLLKNLPEALRQTGGPVANEVFNPLPWPVHSLN